MSHSPIYRANERLGHTPLVPWRSALSVASLAGALTLSGMALGYRGFAQAGGETQQPGSILSSSVSVPIPLVSMPRVSSGQEEVVQALSAELTAHVQQAQVVVEAIQHVTGLSVTAPRLEYPPRMNPPSMIDVTIDLPVLTSDAAPEDAAPMDAEAVDESITSDVVATSAPEPSVATTYVRIDMPAVSAPAVDDLAPPEETAAPSDEAEPVSVSEAETPPATPESAPPPSRSASKPPTRNAAAPAHVVVAEPPTDESAREEEAAPPPPARVSRSDNGGSGQHHSKQDESDQDKSDHGNSDHGDSGRGGSDHSDAKHGKGGGGD